MLISMRRILIRGTIIARRDLVEIELRYLDKRFRVSLDKSRCGVYIEDPGDTLRSDVPRINLLSQDPCAILIETDTRIMFLNLTRDSHEILREIISVSRDIDILVITLSRDVYSVEFLAELARIIKASITIPISLDEEDFYLFRDLVNYYTQVIKL